MKYYVSFLDRILFYQERMTNFILTWHSASLKEAIQGCLKEGQIHVVKGRYFIIVKLLFYRIIESIMTDSGTWKNGVEIHSKEEPFFYDREILPFSFKECNGIYVAIFKLVTNFFFQVTNVTYGSSGHLIEPLDLNSKMYIVYFPNENKHVFLRRRHYYR